MSFKDMITPPEKEGKEKHVPVIEAPSKVKNGEWFEVSIMVGKEVPHPNTLEHHIEGITLYYKEDGAKPVYKVADFTSFAVHVDSYVSIKTRVEASGYLYAIESCNIHGIWMNEADL